MSSAQMTLLLLLLAAGPAGAECRNAACLRMEQRDPAAADAAAALRSRRAGHGSLRPSTPGGTGLNARGNGLGLKTPAGLGGDRAASG